MSYCRFACDGSEVYVYEGQDGITCCGCRLNVNGFCTTEPEEMIKHLALHRRSGHYVPEHAILALWEDVPGAQRPASGEPVLMTHAKLTMDVIRLQMEIKKLERRI